MNYSETDGEKKILKNKIYRKKFYKIKNYYVCINFNVFVFVKYENDNFVLLEKKKIENCTIQTFYDENKKIYIFIYICPNSFFRDIMHKYC